MLTTEITAIIVALIALLGTILTAIFARDKYSRTEAIQLESRLTSLEAGLDNKVNKTKCERAQGEITAIKQKLEDRLDPIWDAIMHELPKVLISPNHPKLDSLISDALNGLEKMSDEDTKKLIHALEETYIDNGKADSGRRLIAVLLRAGIRASKGFPR